jgi:hypothetical protein
MGVNGSMPVNPHFQFFNPFYSVHDAHGVQAPVESSLSAGFGAFAACSMTRFPANIEAFLNASSQRHAYRWNKNGNSPGTQDRCMGICK